MLRRVRWFTAYSTRQLDWMSSLQLTGFGAFLLLPPASLEDSAGLVAAAETMTEANWGVLFLGLGGVSIYALHEDTAAWWWPFARVFAMLAAVVALAVFAAGFLPWSAHAYFYLSTAFLFCGNSLLAAALDAGKEYRRWRGTRDD